MKAEWLTQGAVDLGEGIGAGRIDPVALTETFLEAIHAHPDGTRIYARTTPDRARIEARAAADRARAGMRRGPLDGVPLSWKDLFDSAGTATESGSKVLAGRVPDRDARLLEVATRAGLVCLGKTHLSELAFSGLGVNPVTGTPPNVRDGGAAPGGSSSGAAASVAFGLAPAAIGSDTGGSVRVPAAWNDLVGLKTSHGRLPMQGAVPLARRFDTAGPLTRDVADAAAVFAVLAGETPVDLQGASLSGVRLMVLETVALDDLRPAQAAAFDAALAHLAGAGARIEHRAVPAIAEAMALSAILYTTEAFGIWKDGIARAGDLMFAPVRARFESGAAFSGADYVAAWERLAQYRQVWAEAVAGFDAVVLPTNAGGPPQVARLLEDEEHFVRENLLALRNTRIGNLMDAAVLTLPAGRPWCGLSLMVPPGDERRLLRLGAAAETALRR